MKNRQAKKISQMICSGPIEILPRWKKSTRRAALKTRRPTRGEALRLAAFKASRSQHDRQRQRDNNRTRGHEDDDVQGSKQTDTTDELASGRDGLCWRPASPDVLVDNRKQGPGRPELAEVVAGIQAVDGVLLKTSIGESVVVTEWRHHPPPIPTRYHVFEVRRMEETERTFPVEQGAAALAYHATLEAAIRRRQRIAREIRRQYENDTVEREVPTMPKDPP